MANYDNDELDDEYEGIEEEQAVEEAEAREGSNRNFLLALGVLGAIFLLVVIALVFLALNRPTQPASPAVDIDATNAVIATSNYMTAAAATQARAMLLTPSLTPTATITPTVTRTAVLAPTTAPTLDAAAGAGGGGLTPTVSGDLVDTRTATVAALLTQRVETSNAQTAVALGTRLPTLTNTPLRPAVTTGPGTPTALPDTGFADEVGFPGLFGLAVGLLVVIVLARRLRLSTNH